jgi:predicted lipid-binding transport protein (Tim44 family)
VAQSTEVETRAEHAAHQRDPHAEPSAEWGWHGGFPRGARIGGWFMAAVFFLLLIGNHTGRVENLWLIGLGLGTIGVLVWDLMKRRTSWRR